MLPLPTRRSAKEIGRARLQRARGAFPFVSVSAAHAQDGWCRQRDRNDVAEHRPVAVPADPGARCIFVDQYLLQAVG